MHAPKHHDPGVSHHIVSIMGLEGVQHRTQLSLTQNGEVIRDERPEQGGKVRTYNTIASSEWITPIRIQCTIWDEYDEGTDFY